MPQNRLPKPSFKAGAYLLETLTSGMYNQPLTIYREYIQNAVDSIESIGPLAPRRVNINLDPFARRIEISDNGGGISSTIAEQVLSNLGISNKIDKSLRGFRGIGRLGGIAFSEKVSFITKSNNEDIESIQEWDCEKLNKIINDKKKNSKSLRQVFNNTTHFYQKRVNPISGSYFKVIMEGVSSYKNLLFDIDKVKNYLSEVAPLPFNPKDFSFGSNIDLFLTKNLNLYGTYEILLNGEPIYKPYKDVIKVTKKGFDQIEKIKFFEIEAHEGLIAYGWYGERKNFLGSISKGEKSAGMKVRMGNILIGDSHLLDNCFREPRFNSYVVGEVHVNSDKLKPNSRRDDFIDNELKSFFYNAVERLVGLPLSKSIRLKSKNSSSDSAKNASCRTIKNISDKNDNKLSIRPTESKRECRKLLELVNMCLSCKKIDSCSFGKVLTQMADRN